MRDNGAVMRHSRQSKRPRQYDGEWTFGKADKQHGYMCIASVRIHRIVATAFHGEAPTPEHVVDHIDTNRRNNRPENLRWLTRLENVLKNPITFQRIMLTYGSIENFLTDPSKPRGKLERNFDWMRTVSPEEAKNCLTNLQRWAASDKVPSGGSLWEWIFKPVTVQSQRPDAFNTTSSLVMAKTPGAAQRKWRTPSEFPCCPQEAGEETITTYMEKLKPGAIFARNNFAEFVVVESAMDDKCCNSIWVICEQNQAGAIKPWSLAQVIREDGFYVHTGLGAFFTKDGAEKAFCLAQGIEWSGGDSIDDYC